MRWTSFKRRTVRWGLACAWALGLAPGTAPAQGPPRDSTPPALRFQAAAGSAWRGLVTGDGSGAAYLLQASVASGLGHTAWRLRADLAYLHPWLMDGDSLWENRDASRMSMRGVGAGWGVLNLLRDGPELLGGRAYALAGAGMAQAGLTDSTASTVRRRAASGILVQAGLGMEWKRGDRAVFLETRAVTMRAPGVRSRPIVPLLLGVSF